MLFGVGLIASAVLVLLSAALAPSWSQASSGLAVSELLASAWILAVALPIVSVSSGLRGSLEALSDFKGSNLARIPNGVLGFLLPLLASYFTKALPPIILTLVVARATSAAILRLRLYSRHDMRRLFFAPGFRFESAGVIVKPASWFALTGLTTFGIVYSDRLVLGGALGLASFGWYTLYVDNVTRAAFLPATVTQAFLSDIR